MVEELSQLNDEIIADKDAAFELVSDFTKDSGSETINRTLEKLLCANNEVEATGLCDEHFIGQGYKTILNEVFLKIYRGESFIVDDFVSMTQKA